MIEENKEETHEVKNIGLRCSKHGQLFQDAIFAKVFHTLGDDGQIYEHKEAFCLACLTELYANGIMNGKCGALEPYEITEEEPETAPTE